LAASDNNAYIAAPEYRLGLAAHCGKKPPQRRVSKRYMKRTTNLMRASVPAYFKL
jgi:hypothetical protein